MQVVGQCEHLPLYPIQSILYKLGVSTGTIMRTGRNEPFQEDRTMQIRCQRCGYMFTLSREAIAAALEEVKQSQAKHYNVDCPKCRRQVKVPIKDMQRGQPHQD